MTKNANGAGSKIKKMPGRDLYRARYTDGDGRQKSVYGKTYDECRQKLTAALGNKDKGINVDPGALTFGAYLAGWLNDSVRGSVKDSTFGSYAQQVNKHIIPGLGKVKLKNLNPAHLQRFYRSKLDAGLSARTVQYHHVLIHRALKQAMRWNLVYRNPAEMVDPPRVMRD